MRLRIALWTGLILLALTLPLAGQGSLSSQVLRLLTRDNEWSGDNVFLNGTLALEEADSDPTTTENRLYNLAGTLYWNGVAVGPVSGSGTVTSVGLDLPAEFSETGTPVTASGTLAATWANQTTNKVLASPNGSTGTPSFRALVDADIPNTITIDSTGNVTWASVSKSGSSLADLATRSAADLNSGSLALARLTDGGTAGVPLLAGGGGGDPAYAALDLGGSGVTGTLADTSFPALSGDVSNSAGTVTITLANSGVSAGAYGSATAVPVITVDAKGRITAISTAAAAPAAAVAVASGGTNITSYAVGDIIYASGATTLAKLADVATGNALISGGVTTAPAWGKIGLTTHVSGILPVANGGTGISTVPTNGFVPIGNGTTYVAAAITGTANQVTVTLGSGTITLATPQSIATASTPQFAKLGLGASADATAVLKLTGASRDVKVSKGNSGSGLNFDLSAGNFQTVTLNNNATFTFSNPSDGQSFELWLIQDGTGSRTIALPTIKWAGGSTPTWTTTAGKTDRVFCRYQLSDTSYYCYASLNY